ncbi:MAG: ABC transporter permease [Blastocatellia bacterium]
MKEMMLILKAEFNRHWIQMKRYPFEPVANVVTLFILFMIIVSGFRPLQNSTGVGNFNRTVAGAIIGYVMWFFVVMALSNFSNKLEEEAKLGTLEQLCMASKSLILVISGRLVTDFFYNLFVIAVLFLLLMLSTGVTLSLSAWLLVPLCVTVLGLYGFGFVIGSLSLLFKRIGEVRSIIQIVFLFLAIAPLDSVSPPIRAAAVFLPLTQGIDVMRSIAVDSQPFFDPMILQRLLLVALNSFVYLIIGIFIFRAAERSAFKRGLLAHY